MCARSIAIKVLLVGEGNVGKTSLLVRYAENSFQDPNPEFEFKIRMLDIESKRVKVVLCDTAGQENFRTLTGGMYHGVSGVLVVYDVTAPGSFAQLGKWVDGIKKYIPGKDVVLAIVGNKTDLGGRAVAADSARQWASSGGMEYFETSAKTGDGVEAAFGHLVRAVVERQYPTKGRKKPSGGGKDSGGGCCTVL